MANHRVVVIGGGLAGLSSTMKLAELGVQVDLISLTPVKRSHSVCAQGGINSCNDQTRQLGDSEWKHFDDTVYGGDFLNHQPPVKEMAFWAPKVIDLMDRLGVPFTARAKASSTVAALVARCTNARPLPAPRPDSSCFTVWTNRCGGLKPKAWSGNSSSGTS